MATLLNTVSKNLKKNADGSLSEEATPIQTLAGQAGLAASPTSPGGAAAIGANPDQAKMAGTGPQKEVALKQSTDSVNTLQEAQADKKSRTTATADETDLATRTLEAKKTFGETPVRVQGLIQKAASGTGDFSGIKLKMPADIPLGPGADPAALDAAFSAAVAASLNTALTPDQKQNAYNALRNLAGLSDPKYAEAAAGLDLKVRAAAKQQIDTEGTKATADNAIDIDKAGVQALLPELLPDVDPAQQTAEMARILGIPPEQVATMTIAQLDQAVRVMEEQAGRTTADLSQTAQYAGSAEKQEIRGQAQDLASAGATSYENQLDNLSKSLENADKVDIMGKSMTIEEVLSDDFIVGEMRAYLTAAPDSDIRKNMEADPTMKGLVAFMNGYSKVLTDAVTSLGDVGKENVAIQTDNVGIGTFGAPGDGTQQTIPDSIMEQIYPDWGKLADQRYKKEKLVAAVAALPEGQRAGVVRDIATFVKDPNLAELIPQFAAMAANGDLGKLFSGTPKRMVDTMIDTIKFRKELGKHATDTDWLVNQYFHITGAGNIKQFVEQEQGRALLGLSTNPLTKSLLDKDGDGKLDSDAGASIYKAMSANVGSADSIPEVLAGGKRDPQHEARGGMSQPQANVLAWLGPDIKKDGLQAAVTNAIGLGVNPINLDAENSPFIPSGSGFLALDTGSTDWNARSSQLIYDHFSGVPSSKQLTDLTSLPFTQDRKLAAKVKTAIAVSKYIEDRNNLRPGEQMDPARTTEIMKLLAANGGTTGGVETPVPGSGQEIDVPGSSNSMAGTVGIVGI